MMAVRTSIISLVLALTLFLGLFLSRLDTTGGVIEETRFLMGSPVQVKVAAVTRAERTAARNGIEEAFGEIARVESVLSIFKEDSEISRINRAASLKPVKVSDETYDLIEKCVEYNAKTHGAFDITVGPLAELWGRARSSGKLPTTQEVREASSRVGSQWIELDKIKGTIFFKRTGMSLDLGGVGQGYATDRAIEILKSSGVKNAIVNSSGDMYCMGRRSKRRMWNVGIQHPRDKDKINLTLNLMDKAINTSGDYEKYFMLDGKRYSHVIDPRTGYPVGDDVVSASVIAPDSTTSDILATALCVLGRSGLKMVERMQDIDAIIIINEAGVLRTEMSDGIEKYHVAEEEGS